MTRNRTRTTTTLKGQTLLKGHTLREEGRPYWRDPTGVLRLKTTNAANQTDGRGVCSCNVHSDILPSTRARRRWHVEHKNEVRAMLATVNQAAIEQAS